MLLQKEDPCLEVHYSEAREQATRLPFQELQFNDAQQAFQVRLQTSLFVFLAPPMRDLLEPWQLTESLMKARYTS